MSDRDEFERWIRPWLWKISATLARLGANGPYEHEPVQIAWQAWVESRRDGFVSSGWVDIELPLT